MGRRSMSDNQIGLCYIFCLSQGLFKGNTMKNLIFAGMALLLVGCGGGSSGSPVAVTYDLDDAVSTYYQENHSYILHATNGGNVFTLQFGVSPGSQASFHGTQALTATVTINISEESTAVAASTSTLYFLSGPFEDVGGISLSTGSETVFANHKHLPTAASIGDTGSLDTATIFTDSTHSTVSGHQTDTWTLNASGSNAQFCINAEITGGTNATQGNCYVIDAKGNVLSASVSIDVGGTILDFQ